MHPVYFHKPTVILILSALLLITGCFSSPTPPSPPSTSTPTPVPPLDVKTVCLRIQGKPLTGCDLVVEINNTLGRDLQFEMAVQADGGVLFIPGGDVSPSADRRQSSTRDLIGQGESRYPSFPYQLDKSVQFSGEYVVRVAVFQVGDDTSGKPLFEDKKKVLITVDPEPQFLPSQADFDELFSNNYSIGNIDNLSYWLELTEEEHPTEGKLFVKITSEKDGYMPEVTVTVNPGAILFGPTSHNLLRQLTMTQSPGLINASGSRIMVFPFQMDSHSKDGGYFITVTLRDGENEIIDKAPYRLKISSARLSVEEAKITVNTPTPTPKPTPKPTPTFPPVQLPPPQNNAPIVTSLCPLPDASCITDPPMRAKVRGIIEIRGSANRENFEYYKFEYKPDGNQNWNYLVRFDHPVENGVLMTFNTTTVPSGGYLLRLIVVDRTGNFYPEEQQPVLYLIVDN